MKPSWVLNAEAGTSEYNAMLFKRLTQHLQHLPFELRQLIQKKHAIVGEADFSGGRVSAASH